MTKFDTALCRERVEDEIRNTDRNKRAIRTADLSAAEQSTGSKSKPQRWYVSQGSTQRGLIRKDNS